MLEQGQHRLLAVSRERRRRRRLAPARGAGAEREGHSDHDLFPHAANVGAVALYEKLGFRVRAGMTFTILALA